VRAPRRVDDEVGAALPAPTPAPAPPPADADAVDTAVAVPGPDGALLDPRMVARRIAVRRSEGRRRLHRIIGVAATVAAVAAVVLSTQTPLLDLDHVVVRGAGADVVPAVVEAASSAGASTGTPLLDVDPGRVARAVESVPAIADASVVRRWPGTIIVQVTPRIPVAVVGGALVAADGVVVAVGTSPSTAPPSTVPLVALDGVAAPAGAGERVDAPDLLTVAALVPDEVREHVAAVGAGASEGEVDLRLVGGGIARLGPTTGLGSKLVAVATVLEQVDLTCLATIDARVPSAPSVTRAQGCSS
jgi:cell division protein FtsQ